MSGAKPTCACLIACYNEEQRITNVLSIISQAKTLAEIIVVDDGSIDATAEIVRRDFPQVTLVKLSENSGKAAAIREGLKHVRHEYVFLCDADLAGLKLSEVDDAVTELLNHPELDMIIMKRLREVADMLEKISNKTRMPFDSMSSLLSGSSFSRVSCLLSGERILRVTDLQTIISQPVEHYEIEAAINNYYFEKNGRVCWMPSSAISTFRLDELGVIKFMQKYLKMHAAIIRYLGVRNYHQHVESFCLDNCSVSAEQKTVSE